jgi:tetratricopeptide (TPR) repeat protein
MLAIFGDFVYRIRFVWGNCWEVSRKSWGGMGVTQNSETGVRQTRFSDSPEVVQLAGATSQGKWRRCLLALVAILLVASLVMAGIQSWRRISADMDAPAEIDPQWLDPGNRLQAEAVKLAQRLAGDFPGDVEALFIRGLILNKFVSRDLAAQYWEKCAQLAPDFGEPHYWLGKEWLLKGDYEKATVSFRKAVQLKAPAADTRLQLADALINSGHPELAVPVLDEHARISPQDAAGWFCLGHANTLCGKLDAADSAYRRAVELNPEYDQAWHGLMMVSQKRGDPDKAREYLQRFQECQAKVFARHQASKRRMNDEASLERALATAYTDAGLLYARRGEARTSEACWVRAGEVDSAHLESRIRLLDLYGQQHQPQAALRVLEQLCRIQPENPKHSQNRDALRKMLGQDEK